MFEKTLLDNLIKFSKKNKVRAHMPGHNGGVGFEPRFRRHAFEIDVTEFNETDNLSSPDGILLKSQQYAAKVFGAKQTFYLVNGSTVGIEAAILSVARPGEQIIVDRTCHKSVISAMILAGAEPVFVEPDFSLGMYGSMSPITVMDALHNYPEAVGVILVSPTYYGVCSDIERLAKNIHSAGKFLIVDEAHGAHFVFSDKLPRTALSQGADIVVQSAHKTLPALGQTALLHVNDSSRIDCELIAKNINLLQTSSPSYMLLASIDEAIRVMAKGKGKQLNKVIEKIEELKAKIGIINKLSCVTKGNLENDYDITKLVIDSSKLGITGYGAAELLRSDYGIYPEMADERRVLLYLTQSTTNRDMNAIDRAITDISKAEYKLQIVKNQRPIPVPKMVCGMKKAYFSETQTVSIEASIGEVCAEIVTFCPPCCPVCLPGQVIDNNVLEYLKEFTDIQKIVVVANRDTLFEVNEVDAE